MSVAMLSVRYCKRHCITQFHECPECVREERDLLRYELLEAQANAESWRQQHENRIEDMLRISKELDALREERDRLRESVIRLQTDIAARDAYAVPCRCEENKEIILRLQDERDRMRDSLGQTDEALQLVRKAFEDSAEETDALREDRDRLRSLIVAWCKEHQWASPIWQKEPVNLALFNEARKAV